TRSWTATTTASGSVPIRSWSATWRNMPSAGTIGAERSTSQSSSTTSTGTRSRGATRAWTACERMLACGRDQRPWGLLGPDDHRHEPDRYAGTRLDPRWRAYQHAQLLLLLAHRDHQATPGRELRDQRRRHLGRRCGHHDGVEGCSLGPTARAVPVTNV